jgi:hypothetical protein
LLGGLQVRGLRGRLTAAAEVIQPFPRIASAGGQTNAAIPGGAEVCVVAFLGVWLAWSEAGAWNRACEGRAGLGLSLGRSSEWLD